MLPQTELTSPPSKHESINDLIVHKATMKQIFWPVAESTHFTRRHAGEAFESGLLPAEDRIAHPELVEMAKARMSGVLEEDVRREGWRKIEAHDAKQKEKIEMRKKKVEEQTTTVTTSRWDFKFQDVVVDKASVGRHVPGIGSRYGVPAQDRKKGQVKIPTRVV
jgi:hypothetical protein